MSVKSNKFYVWKEKELHLKDQRSQSSSNGSGYFIQALFDITTEHGDKTKRVYLKRSYGDAFSSTVRRMETKIIDFLPKHVDRARTRVFSKSGELISAEGLTNYDIFYGEKKCETIEICNSLYSVVRDALWLDKLEISLNPLVGCPVIPSLNWRNSCSSGNAKFHWYSKEKKDDFLLKYDGDFNVSVGGWDFLCTSPCYYPTESDVGRYLAVVVDFGEDGMAVGTVCDTPVQRPGGGEELMFEARQIRHCAEQLTDNHYRVMSYNVLADLYLNLEKLEQKDLFFPYCPKEFQSRHYRYPLILKEISSYKADIMFLQEVDFRLQKRFLVRFLQWKGYTILFNCKGNEVNEGLCIAFNDRFELVENGNLAVKLSDLLELPSNSDISEYLQKREVINKIVSTRPTILQLVHLRANNGHRVLAANTHLFFDPTHEEVKLIQTILCIRYISKLLADLELSPQVFFAADLNSTPESHVVRLIQGDAVNLPLLNAMEDNTSLSIQNPLRFHCVSGFPEYTNYTQADNNVGFVGCLDYIWAYPAVNVDAIVPLPSHELVTKYGALPSKIAPSDHLPLIVDVNIGH